MSLEFAAIPAPPVTSVTKIKPCRLIFLILLQELLNIPDYLVTLLKSAYPVQLQAKEALRVNRKIHPVALKKPQHFLVIGTSSSKDPPYQSIESICPLLGPLLALFPKLDHLGLPCLVAFQPFYSSLEKLIRNGRPIFLCDC